MMRPQPRAPKGVSSTPVGRSEALRPFLFLLAGNIPGERAARGQRPRRLTT
jgi:hypothetical protein